jgi:putative heme-binding domain-containing protein
MRSDLSRRRAPAVLYLVGLLWAPGAGAQEADPFAEGVRRTEPLSPEEERRAFELPPGFEIQLVAAEPDIQKPMNLAFDARGRLWASGSVEYPFAAPLDREGKDTIKVLDDTDGDGRAERITTFAAGLNIPIGLYPYKDGVIAFSIPHIYHLRDHDGDGQADERRILYGPFGFERDTHGLNNAFRRSFDGWLYACHGFNNETTVRGADGSSLTMQSGNTYRMRLDGSRVEQFTWGQVNPFGMAFDPLGHIFTADCHSLPLYLLVRGGYYPSFGKPHDGLGFVPPVMSHSHGSTALCGVAHYDAENFPPEYRGSVFIGNVMTSRVHRDSLSFRGSSITAREEADLVRTKDPWFRPVDLQVGPDGALYIADFYNRIIGHYEVPLTHPGRDRFRGRIWRLIYTGSHPASRPAARAPDLAALDLAGLIRALELPGLTLQSLAANEIVDRIGAAAVPAVAAAVRAGGGGAARSHGLWILHRLGALPLDLLETAARDPDLRVRVHVQRILAETGDWSRAHERLAFAALGDGDGLVVRAAAEAIGRHPRFESIAPLLERLRTTPAEDPFLRYQIRQAARDSLRGAPGAWTRVAALELDEADSRAIAELSIAIDGREAASFLVRHLGRHEESREVTVRYVQHAARGLSRGEAGALVSLTRARFAGDAVLQDDILSAMKRGIEEQGGSPREILGDWARELSAKLLDEAGDAAPSWTNVPLSPLEPASDPWVLEERACDDGARARFLSSLPRGESLTGLLRSPEFTAPGRLSFYLAGHDGFPDQPAGGKNVVRLVDAGTGATLARAQAPRHDTARRVDWDLERHAGTRARIEIADGDTAGAYAWIAAGRFEPDVAPLPAARALEAAAEADRGIRLAAEFALEEHRPRLAAIARSEVLPPATRAGAASAIVSFRPDPLLAALAAVSGDPGVADDVRRRALAAVVSLDREEVERLLAEAIRQAPRRLQEKLAETLAGEGGGAAVLLALVAEGRASPRLLQARDVKAKMLAAGGTDAAARIEELTAGLPSESDAAGEAIARELRAYAGATPDLAKGALVFERACSPCHQVGGKGGMIGPQLDGVGNRGLERVVEDLLDPDRNVDVAFRATTFLLDDGTVLTGLHRRDEGATVVIADGEGKEVVILAARIAERVKTMSSLMPANLVETLAPGELHDLLGFLLAQRADAPANVTPESAKR